MRLALPKTLLTQSNTPTHFQTFRSAYFLVGTCGAIKLGSAPTRLALPKTLPNNEKKLRQASLPRAYASVNVE